MINSANSNTYTYAAEATCSQFAHHVEGNIDGLVCVVSSVPAAPVVRNALTASFERLEYGTRPCAWISIAAQNGEGAEGEGAESEGGEGAALVSDLRAGEGEGGEDSPTLTDDELYLIIESIDPLVLVATDTAAAAALSRIFHTSLIAGTPSRLLGRATLTFSNFEHLISTQKGKQKAWSALKKLAR